MKLNTKKLIMTALFAALSCVGTMIIRIPTPGTSGYIHPGDAIVILSGILLGPVYGAFAGGIGSAMSDLLGGYFIYVPITFIVKGLVAFFAGHAFRIVKKKKYLRSIGVLIGGLIDIVLVVAGYGLYEAIVFGWAAAIGSMPANFIQGIGGTIIALLLFPVLSAVPDMFNMMNIRRNE